QELLDGCFNKGDDGGSIRAARLQILPV
ncbi:hypothetical protein A2U01_0092771, partial [Trifolium medium]|nr:hypothetical protein [Trifolium medium]